MVEISPVDIALGMYDFCILVINRGVFAVGAHQISELCFYAP